MMDTNCFTRPNKPLICKRPDFDIKTPVVDVNQPKLLSVDSSTECHITPSMVAVRMVDYLDYQYATMSTTGNSVLEPHGGTGQLVNALLDSGILSGHIMTIEKHYKLVEFMERRFKDGFVKINQGDFLTDFDWCIGEYDRVICNPPFKNIVAHIDQSYQCLKPGGIAVCLVPVSYKKINHEVLEVLPIDTFSSCKVNTKIIRIEK